MYNLALFLQSMHHPSPHISLWLFKMPSLLPGVWGRTYASVLWMWWTLLSDCLVSYKLIHISILTCVNPTLSGCRELWRIFFWWLYSSESYSLVGKTTHERTWKLLQNSVSTWTNKGAISWILGAVQMQKWSEWERW